MCFLALAFVTACAGPEAEIRAQLSERDRETFDRGKSLSTPCWACHDLYGEQNKVGPYLHGLYGRKAGSAAFGGYSEAMKNSPVIWSNDSLERFLLDVGGFIPGTTMNASGPGSRSDIEALVFYLGLVTTPIPEP